MNDITLKELVVDYERDYPRTISHNFPFHAAIINNDLELFNKFVNQGHDLNQKDDQNNSPLMLAIANKNRDMIRTLLNAKVDIQERYNKFNSLLLACMYDLDSDLFLDIIKRAYLKGHKMPLPAFGNNVYDFTFYICLLKPTQSNETLDYLFQYDQGYVFCGIPDEEKAIINLMNISPLHSSWYENKMQEFGGFRGFQENFCNYTGHMYKRPFLNKDIKQSFIVLFFTILIFIFGYFSYDLLGVYGLSPFIFISVLILVAAPSVFIVSFMFPFLAVKDITIRIYDFLFRKHQK